MKHVLAAGFILGATHFLSLQCWAEETEEPVATVMDVEDGTCEECPYQHFLERKALLINATLKASDEVRCVKGAYVIATYQNAFFFMEGTRWNPVGLPGQDSGGNDRHTPLKGSIAFNDIMDADKAARSAVLADARGVRNLDWVVLNLRGFRPIPADPQLTVAVREALTNNEIDVSDIAVKSRGGTILLKGKVAESQQILKAQGVVQGVPGVKGVANGLTVYETQK